MNMSQANCADPRPFKIHRNRSGWIRWYQRWLEAWWAITGQWSLHRAWQAGTEYGRRQEYQRVVMNGGDLGDIMRKVVDLTWNHVTESTEVPSTKLANEIIARSWRELRNERGIPEA